MSRETVRRFLPTGIVAVLLIVGFYYPLPYYISQPGEAVELAPIIQVENRHHEQGSLMLTTVRMGGANFFSFALANFNSYMDVIPKDFLLAHYKSEEHYSRRQLQVMESSQETAILVAYRLAGINIPVKNEGIIVTQTMEGMPAEQHLQIGDVIIRVDQKEVNTSEELITYILGKKKGDSVEITYLRDEQEQTAMLAISELPLSDEEKERGVEPRAGIGISTLTKRSLGEITPSVNIRTEKIGGPSAGLMFTLEIYNQLTEHDITKGYRIAGTGTINAEGNIGRIGGIHQKVVAADKAKVDIFFAPHEKWATNSNYQVALAAAKDIGTSMKVVPVEHVKDALAYLDSLPPKTE
ncbi:SepM family pheromone-processing serine protease [Caldalkalibacillus mannanilyticus]|uniref:SepM family pheromone-processing serine protease n=1 Tax=Caldalkalibacillus mannanilyticus TaxID=1418 RepID=UPI0004693BE6|nr:SepM family pheromone-processing serine protease [Caldalkalibacillus mannanilyticus]